MIWLVWEVFWAFSPTADKFGNPDVRNSSVLARPVKPFMEAWKLVECLGSEGPVGFNKNSSPHERELRNF